MDSQEPTRPEYAEIQEMVMNVLQKDIGTPGEKALYENATRSFIDMIAFLETMYVSTILSMVGSFIKTMDESDDKAFVEHLRHVIKKTVDAVSVSPQATLEIHYADMIEMIGLPDPLAEKTHNQKVAEDIMREMGEQDG
jgi:hypothetical protein